MKLFFQWLLRFIGIILFWTPNAAFASSDDTFIVPIKPFEVLSATQQKKVVLGSILFNDKKLSHNKEMSCATCHISSKAYADGQSVPKDNAGKKKEYNTPSISYSVYNYYFTWTGQFKSLQEHLNFLITNPSLMNRQWDELVNQLKRNQQYRALFHDAGYQNISKKSIEDAIIRFEESLAKQSRFDLYLLGDKSKLTRSEIAGFKLFKESGCVSCHQGINIGGNVRQRFGVIKPYFDGTNVKKRDLGYFNISNNPDDINFFRVPSLRNVSQTAPYFHDGSVLSLEDAIEVMFSYQLGIEASANDISNIKSFLISLEPLE